MIQRGPLLLLVAAGLLAASGARASVPTRLLYEDFEHGVSGGWSVSGAGTVGIADGYRSAHGGRIEQPASAGAGSTSVTYTLPVEQVRNTMVRCSAILKARDIAPPPQPYNGAKFMLIVATPAGTRYPGHDNPPGTYDWQPIGFETPIPADAVSVKLLLGVEATTGTAWYDEVRVDVVSRANAAPPAPAARPIYRSHPGVDRLRGMNVPPTITAADLVTLGRDWHANLIRYQLAWQPTDPDWRDDSYERWIGQALDHLDTLLPVCRATGLRVLIDLHTPPGGSDYAHAWNLFRDRSYEHRFLALWDKISRRYNKSPVVWGYDLANEPIEADIGDGLMDWPALAAMAAKIVRRNDRAHAIVVETFDWDACDALQYLEPLAVPGVVYSIHFYEPHAFTHQGVFGQPTGIAYPGVIDGARWDRATMQSLLGEAAAYQKRYRVPIYVGEFSAIRWAPDDGAYRWLKDAVDIFEKHGWDWTYHAYREWPGWSVEYGPDRNAAAPDPQPTNREMLLRSWFARNTPRKGAR